MKKFTSWENVPICLDSAMVALILNISVCSVKISLREGKIKGVKIAEKWVISKDALRAFIENND